MASFKSLLTPLLKATKPVGRDPKKRRNFTEGETKKFGIVSRHVTWIESGVVSLLAWFSVPQITQITHSKRMLHFKLCAF